MCIKSVYENQAKNSLKLVLRLKMNFCSPAVHHQFILHPNTVETLYSTIPYTTILDKTRWAHGPQNLQRPIRTLIVLLGLRIKQIFVQFVCLLPVPLTEWTHMWPAASVNNDGRTDYHRLSHFTALPAGVNNHLRCIHKGLTAFSRVTPPIQMMIKQF